MARQFNRFAETLEEVTGSFYDREEQFVNCSECGEPIYECDWEVEDYLTFHYDGEIVFTCPICGCVLHVDSDREE